MKKFGGKITGLISMIAVLLIVYNGLVIVTAAGETEKISQGKKGIMWTIIGLAVTMFAYVIVKTVIMFAYGVYRRDRDAQFGRLYDRQFATFRYIFIIRLIDRLLFRGILG